MPVRSTVLIDFSMKSIKIIESIGKGEHFKSRNLGLNKPFKFLFKPGS